MTDTDAVLPCQQGDPDDWHSDQPRTMARAVTLCRGCPLMEECRQLGQHEPEGVWGGLTAAQRDDWRRTGDIPTGPAVVCRAGLHDLTAPDAFTKGTCRACMLASQNKRADRRRRRTHCGEGHDLTLPNALLGYRCRECKRRRNTAASRLRRAAAKEAAA